MDVRIAAFSPLKTVLSMVENYFDSSSKLPLNLNQLNFKVENRFVKICQVLLRSSSKW